MVGSSPLHFYTIHDFGGRAHFCVQVVRLSHPVDGSLDLFVTLLHQLHHVGIHEINRQISTQQNDNGSMDNGSNRWKIRICFPDVIIQNVLIKDVINEGVSISYRRTHRDNLSRNLSVHRLHQVRNDHIPNRHNHSGKASSPTCIVRGPMQSSL